MQHPAFCETYEGSNQCDIPGANGELPDAPRSAKLQSTDAAASGWTARVSKALLNAPPLAVDDDARVRATAVSLLHAQNVPSA